MKPSERTKTAEQCRAEAALLDMYYGNKGHVYIKTRYIHANHSITTERYCAETMEELASTDVSRRIRAYKHATEGMPTPDDYDPYSHVPANLVPYPRKLEQKR